jgi:isoleucyl-tRNA synthetase
VTAFGKSGRYAARPAGRQTGKRGGTAAQQRRPRGTAAVTGRQDRTPTPGDTSWSTPRPAPAAVTARRRACPRPPRFPRIEEAVLAYWAKDDTFQASVRSGAGVDGANEFVFYDGPPFANGLPHYGHLLTGYVKDIVPRYQTMRGRRVERRFGWDTHGLPAELEAMSQLGIKTTDEIPTSGSRRSTTSAASRSEYTGEWQDYVTRQARWVDFDNDYKTLDPTSWSRSSGPSSSCTTRAWPTRASGSCPTAGTTRRRCPTTSCGWTRTSTRTGRTRRHRRLPARDRRARPHLDDDAVDPAVEHGRWPCTPTSTTSSSSPATRRRHRALPARAGAARGIHPRARGRRAERIVARLKGAELVGRRYTPPFSYYPGHANAHQVSAADFVTTEDGTGLVHMSPGFGEDDNSPSTTSGSRPSCRWAPTGASPSR